MVPAARRTLSRAQAGRRHGFRSGLEADIAAQLRTCGVDFGYESCRIAYTRPASRHTYTPDFILPNGIIVETKGRWVLEDRRKMALVKAQHPALDIRIVFTNPRAKIAKGSRTTYGAWAAQHGFPCATRRIPEAWLTEPARAASYAALCALKEHPACRNRAPPPT